MDPEETMANQFWELAVHHTFQRINLFPAMTNRLKETAEENGAVDFALL
jgi:hypothetical protein